MRLLATLLVLSIVLLLAYLRGGRPELLASLALALPLGLDPIYHEFFGYRDFAVFDFGHAVFDGLVMVVFGWLAINSNRLWTLMIAALQVQPLVAHFIAAVEIPGVRGAYWAMTELPFYAQTLIVIIGLTAHHSRKKRVGRYPDWRFPVHK